jgi:hypothetical protein
MKVEQEHSILKLCVHFCSQDCNLTCAECQQKSLPIKVIALRIGVLTEDFDKEEE